MKISKSNNGTQTTIHVCESITALNSIDLEDFITSEIEGGADDIVIDLSKMEYTSSAGLRVFIKAQKMIDGKGGKMKVCGVNDFVMEIFNSTGTDIVLNIE